MGNPTREAAIGLVGKYVAAVQQSISVPGGSAVSGHRHAGARIGDRYARILTGPDAHNLYWVHSVVDLRTGEVLKGSPQGVFRSPSGEPERLYDLTDRADQERCFADLLRALKSQDCKSRGSRSLTEHKTGNLRGKR